MIASQEEISEEPRSEESLEEAPETVQINDSAGNGQIQVDDEQDPIESTEVTDHSGKSTLKKPKSRK